VLLFWLLFLSWGKNFGFLTDFFIKYIPLYNKFRAVSSIQVIIELCLPLLAILGVAKFLSDKTDVKNKLKSLKSSLFIIGGLLLVFVLFGKYLFSFEGINDAYYARLLKGLDSALMVDRKEAFFNDSLRSLLLVLPVAAVLWFNIKQKITKQKTILILGLLMVFDLVFVDINYVNDSHFVNPKNVEKPIQKTQIDEQILKRKRALSRGEF